VKLTARGAARAREGHALIWRTDVSTVEDAGADEVVITDERGRTLGSALFAPEPSPIALRVYAHKASHVRFDDLLPDLILRSDARRAGMGDVYRMVHAEADLVPGLVVDRYGDAAVLQTTTAALDRREEAIAELLRARLGLRLIVARDDGSMRDMEGLPRTKRILVGEREGEPTTRRIREGKATLELDLLADAKTGTFLDQRENHARVAEVAGGPGEVLDAFTYHGGFGLALAAADPGARVLALDEDPAAVARARRNAELSGLHNLEARAADAFEALQGFEREGRKFRVVVVDPPALGKRKGSVETALRAYKELNLRALRIVERDGWVVTCSCSGKVTPVLFEQMLIATMRNAHRQVAIVERRGAGRDHPVLLGAPETEYLKCFLLRVS
jgi:23S rRNA (cytosine1962-C5)-methyltransferase